jgi:choline/glycine/proline betaine transport protein
MQAFIAELAGHGVDAVVINEADQRARLEVYHGNEVDFVYSVQERSHSLPDASIVAKDQVDAIVDGSFSRAEVHLAEGGQDYDVMGWSEEQIIVDILNQYEDHLHFLHTVRS